ncbi:MAG TPA: hypothetical protein VD913_04405 [bacterium]|nr:hypothetical protein [bacterium]
MNWDKIRAQAFAARILKVHTDRQKLASAYLVTGNSESGKEDLALAFALSLLCPEMKCFEPCDCPVCTKIIHGNHPDVRWGPAAAARSVKIEDVRELMGWASLKPYEGAWKIFILEAADRLTLEASNAFLKTLEEPPKHTVFLLLCESKAQVIETIQSRSFEVRLHPLETGFSSEENDSNEELLEGIKKGDWESLLDKNQGKSREELKAFLDALMNDLILLIRRESVLMSGNGPLMAGWLEAFDKAYECKDALDANANQKLVLSRLEMHLRRILPENERAA